MADENTEVTGTDRVVLKPDGRGGYTVDKFGASAHFNAEQWRSLLQGVDALEEEQADEEKQDAASVTRKPQSGK